MPGLRWALNQKFDVILRKTEKGTTYTHTATWR